MTKPIIAWKSRQKDEGLDRKAKGIPRQGSLDQFPGDGGGAIRAGGKGGAFRHDGRPVCAVAGHARYRARQEGRRPAQRIYSVTAHARCCMN